MFYYEFRKKKILSLNILARNLAPAWDSFSLIDSGKDLGLSEGRYKMSSQRDVLRSWAWLSKVKKKNCQGTVPLGYKNESGAVKIQGSTYYHSFSALKGPFREASVEWKTTTTTKPKSKPKPRVLNSQWVLYWQKPTDTSSKIVINKIQQTASLNFFLLWILKDPET